jgi:hypothetical protein
MGRRFCSSEKTCLVSGATARSRLLHETQFTLSFEEHWDGSYLLCEMDEQLVNPWGILVVNDMLVVADKLMGTIKTLAPLYPPVR